MLVDAEWSCQHAAENQYCRWCNDSKAPDGKRLFDTWQDQLVHAPDCQWVRVMGEAAKART